MQRKNSTGKKAAAKALAAHVTAIINNPNTPNELREAVVDAISDMDFRAQLMTKIMARPEFIEELIAATMKGGSRA